jgi:hypothetical protein
MFKKNTAVAGFPVGKFIKTDDGSEVTSGTPTCKRLVDGSGGSCAGAATYDATAGLWKIDLAAADMNGDIVGLAFSLADCQPITYTIKTVANGADEIYSRIGAPAGSSLSADVGALLAQTVRSTLNVSGTQSAADGAYYLVEYLACGAPYYGHSGGGWYLWYSATMSKWLLSTATPPLGQSDTGILPLAYWHLSATNPVGTYAAVGYANPAVVSGNYSNPGTLVDLAIAAVRRASRLPGNPSAAGDAMALTNDAVENMQDGLATSTGVSGVFDAVVQIKAKTDNLPASPAAAGSAMTLQPAERDAVANALLDAANAVDGKTPRQALRIISAILAGRISGAGSGTETFRGLDDQHDRVIVTADVSGNRTNVTYP